MAKFAEKFVKGMEAIKTYMAEHEDNFSAIAKGSQEVYALAKSLAEKRKVDVSQVLTGDPYADMAILQAAGVESVLKKRGLDVDLEDILKFVSLAMDLGINIANLVV